MNIPLFFFSSKIAQYTIQLDGSSPQQIFLSIGHYFDVIQVEAFSMSTDTITDSSPHLESSLPSETLTPLQIQIKEFGTRRLSQTEKIQSKKK